MFARVLASVFLALHGLVHLLYFAQSARIFELKPGMNWPVGSWAISRLVSDSRTRTAAKVVCVLVAVGFVLGAVGLIFGQPWWRSPVLASAVVSAVLFLLCWNGSLQNLDGQGGIGILLDALILVSVLILRWP